MSLNDTDVHKQIQRLVAFIDQEANTKVEEIDAKAEEEFQIEKSRLVQNQRLKIMDQDSNLMHEARLKVLHNRERFIEELLQEARKRLYVITKDSSKYSATLGGLITQGLLQLVEPEATIKCRAEDYDLVKSLVPTSVKEVKRQTGIDCNITVDNANFLPQDSCGGVEIYVRQGRICVNNTLDARLDQVAEKMMPRIREQLFGVNKNRKFCV
ncbi:V-type proton ATPase subunit E [Echinococcus granulosus]|uniref:V-type proton ATPase subunit E n=1 Tax=Echinococcus granulosus TaxID=6210 RepID=U6JB19_ECHGR|nr:V-type proton ATPase subunit E [Echinococcus granulosus]EUB59540.1 V-type proton ATPase subunit E [Echinococcus granulosus]CDS20512.1 Vacuolar proton pump subunit E [Echinococcus granulosus]